MVNLIIYITLIFFLNISEIISTAINTFKYKDELTNVLQSIGLNANEILSNSSEQCLTSIENTYDCFNSINNLLTNTVNTQKIDEMCDIYNSQNCDFFRNNVVTGNSGCNNEYDKKFFSMNFDVSIFYYSSACTKNSNLEYCPAVNYYRSILTKDLTNTTDANKVDIINQSLNDPKCTEQMKRIIAVSPSLISFFELTFPNSGEAQDSLDVIKTALDVTPMQKQMTQQPNTQEISGILNNNKIFKPMSFTISIICTLISLLIII